MKSVTIDELIDAFLSGQTHLQTGTLQKPGELKIINDKLISFETVICERHEGKFLINTGFYSRKTEIAQSALLKKIPKDKQIVIGATPFQYWGSLSEYLNKDKT